MKKLLLAILLIFSAATANASLIYNVNRVIGDGTVTGFIETDGTLGVLSNINITDWELTLSHPDLYGGTPDVIDFATSFQTTVHGTGLTASATELLFDFSAAGLFLLQGSNPNNFWCMDGTSDNCAFTPDSTEMIGRGSASDVAIYVSRSGTVVIANATVPEPTTLVLMSLGLAGIGYRRYLSY